MSQSQRSKEGYFLSDHRESPGGMGAPCGQMIELPTFTCSHCQALVVMNMQRTRSRGYCSSCDHLICDKCDAAKAAGATCLTYKAYLDQLQNAAAKATTQTSTPTILLTDAR
jgi:hypothetical protein